MAETSKTKTRARGENLPAGYSRAARRFCVYSRWTVEEAANLLCGCLPDRELFLPGPANRTTDDRVVEMENRIRTALDHLITRLASRRYFDKTWVPTADVFEWAEREGIEIPAPLAASRELASAEFERTGYSTPCMAAVSWAVDNFWQDADLRDPPTPGEVITAMLQAFPELTAAECEMVEYVARHPAARPDPVP